ncbi:50S ribosomal protein L9 [Candidatus Campbellbacteria bacterium RIFOXYC2_FULL_35_25]|uniref:Large ribosomal subunit protein bL9 n=1 Tax=Candidatus Campbellbacteria bacterium RIFOXYC2_FULL_35_25 TaxID=1797582 RepID=A0A1F5EJ68_9BACT|nr:MAG: 50S ribosomal protein L9 [Candidatus Campbellbacteria bacterium RIFOXYC2_FULL_35_25]
MKIILLQNVPKVGKKYDLKNIADGYALNFLIPKKLAKLATKDAKKEIEILKEKQQLKQVKEEAELMEDILKLKDSVINITTKVNKEGHLFAGIDKKAIVDVIKDQKALDIGEDFIVLEKPIKEASEHVIKLKVGSKEFSFTLKITAEKE